MRTERRVRPVKGWRRVAVAAVATVAAAPLFSSPARAHNHDNDVDMPEAWDARYAASATSSDSARAVAVAPDGSTVFVTGRAGASMPVIAYDAVTGAERWSVLDAPPFDSATGVDIAVTSDSSSVVVTGSEGTDVLTAAYDASTGAMAWRHTFDTPRDPTEQGVTRDHGRALNLSPDGSRAYVAAQGHVNGQQPDALVLAYEIATGNLLWERRYDGPGDGADSAIDVAVSPDGADVLVLGQHDYGPPTHAWDWTVISYDQAGTQRWANRVDGNGSDHPVALGVDPLGSRVYVASYVWAGSIQKHDVHLAGFDLASGSLHWAVQRAEEDTQGPLGLAVGPGGDVYLTGVAWKDDIFRDNDRDTLTLAYSGASGTELWSARHQTWWSVFPLSDYGRALDVSGEGAVVYVGGSNGRYGPTTLAYSATSGAPLWTAYYDEGAFSSGDVWDVAVRPDGLGVFSAGDDRADNTAGLDMVTLAYCVSVVCA